uniref:PXCC family protein n=1 Tax=Scytodes thoracica TaxID=1112478 RepID=A0A0A0V658_SCYTH|nr:PXCC family protein [Scytodes thoracica]
MSNMKTLGLFLCIVLLVVAEATSPQKFDDGCSIEGNYVAVGATYDAKSPCARLQCTAPGAYMGSGCPEMSCGNRESQIIPGDPDQPYPGCCDQTVCL